MTLTLPPPLARFVQQQVEAGRYESSGEVVLEALRVLEHLERAQEARRDALRADIAEAVSEADRGDTVAFDVAAVKAAARARRAA